MGYGLLGWCWAVLGKEGEKRRRRLHLCREVGCLAASLGHSAIHPSLLPPSPSNPLPQTTTISILPPFMWGAEVWLASTAVVWYSGRMMPDCLLGCHTHMQIDTLTHTHGQLALASCATTYWAQSSFMRRKTLAAVRVSCQTRKDYLQKMTESSQTYRYAEYKNTYCTVYSLSTNSIF